MRKWRRLNKKTIVGDDGGSEGKTKGKAVDNEEEK